ncbi:S41 family peptidase [Mucilaginibacter sp. dw_454]|uniref:S41 family peptidase n=1 Tax=Mucilaginibacter sp. dw_454 TaxID=2720079 RepID=UPI001BD3D633|nr:S41 family peptidase [Mucilaginibacter sp. dw_454]
MKKTILAVLLASAFFAACKKDKNNNGGGPPKTGSTLDFIKDSVYLYAKEDYYWYSTIPAYNSFNPRSFTGSTDLAALTNEVNAISQTNSFEYYAPSPGEAKYSFIDQGEVSTELNGTNSNFGFSPLYNDVNDLRVKYVYTGSPADLAGVKRGYKIVTINGNSSFSYDGATGTNTNFVINALLNSSTVTMTLQKPDLSTLQVTLNAADYTTNPVITYKAIPLTNGKVVGYMVFNTFTSDDNADPKLDQAFNYFQSQGVTDLVVDLRYNGGGFVSTAEYIDNYIVPAAKNNTTMYSYYFNDILANNKETLLAHQVRRDPTSNQLYNLAQINYSVASNTEKFTKKGSLNLSRVFFIVTGSTASAAELTINNLRPHLDVQLIGTTTYGKPVGFFDIDINKYQLYIPEFSTKNSAAQGDYYSGMTPGTSDFPGIKDYDDVTKEFGDTTETLLHHAITYVNKGTYSYTAQKVQGLGAQKTFSIDQANNAAMALDGKKFKGMVYNKKK